VEIDGRNKPEGRAIWRTMRRAVPANRLAPAVSRHPEDRSASPRRSRAPPPRRRRGTWFWCRGSPSSAPPCPPVSERVSRSALLSRAGGFV